MNVRKLRRWKHADRGPLREMDFVCFPTDTSFWNDSRYHWWRIENAAYAGLRIEKNKKTGEEIARFTRCGVMPDHRGKGLQQVLIKARLAWCKRRGIRTVKTYTCIKNQYSAANLRALGFKGRKSRDGKWLLFTKDLT